MSDSLDRIIDQVSTAMLSRDYDFAEKILLTQLNKTDTLNDDEIFKLKSLLGELYIKSENSEKGLLLYKELNELKPNDIDILNNLGIIFRRLNLFIDSVAVLNEARKLDTKVEETLYNLGNTYKTKGDYKRAVQCFKEVVERNPYDALAYNHLGTLYMLCNDFDKSLQTYQQGLRIDPNNPFLNYNIAEIYKDINIIAKLRLRIILLCVQNQIGVNLLEG